MSHARWNSRLKDSASWIAVIGALSIVLFTFGWLMIDLLSAGASQVSWSFLTDPVEDAGRSGGIGPVLISTLGILAVCLGAAVPIGLGTAIFQAEFSRTDSRATRMSRRLLDLLAAMPSIVFGLFGLAFFADFLGLGFSILSGGLTLACMVLPVFIRLVELGLRDVPQEYRLGAAALGLGPATTLFHILLPAAAPSIGAALVLGIGRALAETAALIFTAGYVTRTPESIFDSGRALSVHIYDLAMNVPGGNDNAYATATVLVLVLLILNAFATSLIHFAARRARATSKELT